MNLNEWSTILKKRSASQASRVRSVMRVAGEHVEETAKHNIGTLQPQKGVFSAWKPLAPSTIADKRRLGYDFSPDHNPLLRTGDLRDSIELIVLPNGFEVGSDSEIAEYQEFGTRNIPPRPFVEPALFQNLPVIGRMLGRVFTYSAGAKIKADA